MLINQLKNKVLNLEQEMDIMDRSHKDQMSQIRANSFKRGRLSPLAHAPTADDDYEDLGRMSSDELRNELRHA